MRLLSSNRCTLDNFLVTIRKRLVSECDRNLLESTPSRFHIVEVTQTRGEKTEARNDNVEVPANASECIWRDHSDDEVEDPVRTKSNVSTCLVLRT